MQRAHTSGKQTRTQRNSLFPCVLVAAERDGLEAYRKIKLNKRKKILKKKIFLGKISRQVSSGLVDHLGKLRGRGRREVSGVHFENVEKSEAKGCHLRRTGKPKSNP